MADIFMKIGDIEGESKDDKHPNWIEIQSWSFGISQGASALRPEAEAPALQDISVVKNLDKATPILFLACASGQHIPEATLTARKAGGTQDDYFIIKMTDLLVSSVAPSTSGEVESVPTESVSLNFSKIQITYRFQDETGVFRGDFQGGWDLKKNQKV